MEIETPIIKGQLENLRNAVRERRALCEELNKVLKHIETKGKLYTSESSLEEETLKKWGDKLNRIMRKLNEVSCVETDAILKLHSRLHYLNGFEVIYNDDEDYRNNIKTVLESPVLMPISPARMKSIRIVRFLVDHMARSGYHKSAKHLAESSRVENLVDSDVFRTTHHIVTTLDNHDTSAALEWCSRNKNKLKKIKSRLEFSLRCQYLIEMARDGATINLNNDLNKNKRKVEAVEYARKHLSQYASTEQKQLQETMATLIFGPRTKISKYRSLYSSSRWVGLKKLFLSELCQITSLPGNSFINIYLQAGLASLKTHNCGTASSSLEDPMHTPEFKLLASSLPYAKHNNSKLICYITKLKMNENNPPLVLPNGYVYSKAGIELLVSKSQEGLFYCPRTGDGPYNQKSDVVKAFIS